MISNKHKGLNEGEKAMLEKKIADLNGLVKLQKENLSKCRCDCRFEK